MIDDIRKYIQTLLNGESEGVMVASNVLGYLKRSTLNFIE